MKKLERGGEGGLEHSGYMAEEVGSGQFSDLIWRKSWWEFWMNMNVMPISLRSLRIFERSFWVGETDRLDSWIKESPEGQEDESSRVW